MKITHFIIVFILFMSTIATAQNIPSDIHYIKASNELNDKAQNKLESIFSNYPIKINTLLGERLICGPQLWRDLKNENPLKNMKITPAKIIVPVGNEKTQEFEGALLQSKTELSAFHEAFKSYLGPYGSAFAIRKPNVNELAIYWSMIPYDITEPIFIAENKDHKFLIHYLEDGSTIFWIGDFQNMYIKK